MWRCKKCGGEIVAVVAINTTVNFNIDKDGDITEPNIGFTLDEIARDNADKQYYYCEDCCNESEGADIGELEDIAEWEEE